MNGIIGAIIEAWEEVRINKMRVILSLIGVGAAVWAFATTLAIGQMMVKTAEVWMSYSGRPGVVSVSVSPATDSSALESDGTITAKGSATLLTKLDAAAATTAERIGTPYLSRNYTVSFSLPGTPREQDCTDIDCSEQANAGIVTLQGIDPAYFDLNPQTLTQGRLLVARDANLGMNPTVINETLWETLGSPALSSFPRIYTDNSRTTGFTVVGIVRDKTSQDSPIAFIHADTFSAISKVNSQFANDFWGGDVLALGYLGEEDKDAQVLKSIVTSEMGKGYEISSSFNEGIGDALGGITKTMTSAISGIGAIVILIGALGLLTVSIVTVQQRIREIGIRRAVGASARRVFFAVFMESVVATTVAGFLGVIASVATLQFVPDAFYDSVLGVARESLGGYPMIAALVGVAIAAGVGALCGIIPATIAVRKKPIDAIRF